MAGLAKARSRLTIASYGAQQTSPGTRSLLASAKCTAAALSAQTPPAGATGGADWWKTYAFSDSFHPTPYGHQLVSQLVSRSLARAGWL